MSIDPALIAPAPLENDALPAIQESFETLNLLARRRSTKAGELHEPGPNSEQIDALIRLAARVPDHGKLGPWRFVVIEGEGRARAAAALAAAYEGDVGRLEAAKALFMRAPVCIMVVSAAAPHPKIPEWEQILSAGAACYGLLIAAHAMGFAGAWLTEWPAYDPRARAGLGLAEHERIAGLVYLGTAEGPAVERLRPEPQSRVTRF